MGTKTLGLQSTSRWVRRSVYLRESYRRAVEEQLDGDPKIPMFGLQNHSRVAVTTTVGTDTRLIANYQAGGTEKALCSSAAPPYFQPISLNGVEFRDGGLKASNPVQLALDEAKLIWGKDRLDLLLSIGTGQARTPQLNLVGINNVDEKLREIATTWLRTMNGEKAWEKFHASQMSDAGDTPMRCYRCNIAYQLDVEPAFDDIETIEGMRLDSLYTSGSYDTKYTKLPGNLYEPVSGECQSSVLEVQADILKASLYFFQITRILKGENDKFAIHGRLRCRLGLNDGQSFEQLLKLTKHFYINGQQLVGTYALLMPDRLLNISVQFEHVSVSDPIRIDVNFGGPYSVTISGFPMDIQVLRTYCMENGIEEEVLEAENSSDGDGSPFERAMTPTTDDPFYKMCWD
ncbi:hypothetical protein TWF718_001733 [Orbilia javanica]|uniref:PNPLA domain-containing protein n=1 Tax=Orbilia javanica TaxID=47235 RepID=A0AAN8RSQ6_9PEZI